MNFCMLEKQNVKEDILERFDNRANVNKKGEQADIQLTRLTYFQLINVTLVTPLLLQAIQIGFSLFAAQLTFFFNDVD